MNRLMYLLTGNPKYVGDEKMYRYLFSKITFEEADIKDDIWTEVFRRIPEIRQWFKKRQMTLFKLSVTGDKTNELIRGAIMENMLPQRYDLGNTEAMVKVEETELKIPEKKGFLASWANPK
jgi:hypothetical protein